MQPNIKKKNFSSRGKREVKGKDFEQTNSIAESNQDSKDNKNDNDEDPLNDEDEDDKKMTEENHLEEIQVQIQQRNYEDLIAKDINHRTLLHRAALEQQFVLMSDIISDYKEYLNEKHTKNEKYATQTDKYFTQIEKDASLTIDEKIARDLKKFINKPDKFGNTPLINACSQSYSGSSRHPCVKLLLENGADVNIRNKRTLWNGIYWIAYHGDEESAKLLLDKFISINQPDYQGFYPLDIFGKQNHKDNAVGIELIRILCKEMKTYYMHLNEDTGGFDRFWDSPMLKTSILFWAVKFKRSVEIKDICEWPNTYIELPMLLIHKMTPVHMAAKDVNDNILHELVEQAKNKEKQFKTNPDWIKKFKNPKFSFILENNEALSIPKKEKKFYDPKFLKKIRNFAQKKLDYEKELHPEFLGDRKFFDKSDLYGNTPLHLASMLGRDSCVKMLIREGSDIDQPNREGFRPRELTKNPAIKKIYLEEYSIIRTQKTTKEVKNKNEISKQVDTVINKFIRTKITKTNGEKMGSRLSLRSRNNRTVANGLSTVIGGESVDDTLKNVSIYNPELVIRFKKKSHKKLTKMNSRINVKDDLNADRINFYISLLMNAKFEVYLAPSIEDGYYYVMLSLSESQLYEQCQNLKMRLKLIDSYNYEIYDVNKEANFEPLRSRQRQEIIYLKVNSILDLNKLKSEGLVQDYFLMHSQSGITHIRKKWILSPKWYWPQPLNQVDDYLKEGKQQNFSSVTYLKQYLGEKISFFFAWRSFVTCFMLPLAIPGLIIQIYLVVIKEYHSEILPFWVFYVSLWTTVMVEFWKRKCSEINSRWGTLDLMNDESWMSKEFRNEFSGDECVSSVSQQITKYSRKVSYVYFLLSLPILLVLLGCCIGTYFLSKLYKDTYAVGDYKSVHSTLAGLLNGIMITLLNFLYTYIARWFVNKENHKFQKDYENSLIIKSFTFRVLNSFFAIFYVAFIESTANFQDLFETLWPILIYKQASSIGVQVLLPWIKYKYYQRKYFKLIQKKAIAQQGSNTKRGAQMKIEGNNVENQNEAQDVEKEDAVIKLAKDRMLQYHDYWDRVVIYLSGSDAKDSKLIKNCDMDQVELNYYREPFLDTVDNYAEGFIAFGYVTMFTAAFPIGPMIALVVDAAELKWKIFSFLFALKRPLCEKSTGIGTWMDIWEILSIVSVFTNFLLLFFSPVKFSTFISVPTANITITPNINSSLLNSTMIQDINNTLVENFNKTINNATLGLNITSSLNGYKSTSDIYRLWLVIIMVFIIIFLKFVFRAVIPDKPKWVIDEEERQKSILESDKGQEKLTKSAPAKSEKERVDTSRKNKIFKLNEELKEKKGIINELERERDKWKNQVKQKIAQSSTNITSFQKNAQEYKLKVISLFLKTFKIVEHELLILRLEDVSKYDTNSLFMCCECHKARALLECLDCQEHFCKLCYKNIHVTNHHLLGKDKPTITGILKHETLALEDCTLTDRTKYKQLLEQKQLNLSKKELPKKNKKLEKSVKETKSSKYKDTQIIDKKSEKNTNKINLSNYKTLNDWKKFENFSLPVYERSSFFPSLIEIYGFFFKIYVENNGLVPGRNTVNLDLAISEYYLDESPEKSTILHSPGVPDTKGKVPDSNSKEKNGKDLNSAAKSNITQKSKLKNEFKNINGHYLRIRNEFLSKILEMEDFNIEDKLFLNKVAFLGFRKYGHQFSFEEFHRFCKRLQDGNSLQKMVLLFELLEFSENSIEKEIVKEFTSASLLRNIVDPEIKSGAVIDELYGNEETFTKNTLLELMMDKKEGAEFRQMMFAFMQQNKP